MAPDEAKRTFAAVASASPATPNFPAGAAGAAVPNPATVTPSASAVPQPTSQPATERLRSKRVRRRPNARRKVDKPSVTPPASAQPANNNNNAAASTPQAVGTAGDLPSSGANPTTSTPDKASASIGSTPSNTAIPTSRPKSSISKKNSSSSRRNRKNSATKFAALTAKAIQKQSRQFRKVPVPPHRMTPLRNNWMQLYEPIVRHLKLQIRMNLATKNVQLKPSAETKDAGALQKGEDFVKAFVLGFAIPDAIALIRLDDLYIDTFEVKDIRSTLKGDHLARAVGRIAGKDGRTKFTIENATKTRIVVADTKIHILGSYENTRLARNAISSLVLGSAPGKIYNKLRTVSARLNQRNF